MRTRRDRDQSLFKNCSRPEHLQTDYSDFWCESDTELASGDFGTPGELNEDCFI